MAVPSRQPKPPPLADLIVEAIRSIAEKQGMSLEDACEVFKQQVKRRAEELSRKELRLRRQHEPN